MFVKGKSKTIQANKGYQSVTVEMAGNDIRFLYIGDNFAGVTSANASANGPGLEGWGEHVRELLAHPISPAGTKRSEVYP